MTAATRARRPGTGRDSDRIAALHEQLTEQVRALVSGDAWRAMLDAAVHFHRYSPNNVLLIRVQRPDATRVAGFRTWLKVGRHVRKGEKGIAVLAPCIYKRPEPDDGQPPDPSEPTHVLRGFRAVYVFDVSQTDGDPLPDVPPVLLDGDDPGRLWDALASIVTDEGFRLTRGDCQGANGRTYYDRREVRVRDDVSDAQACKTLAHELAHVLMHEHGLSCRERREVEAESVAYVVCHAAGLATADYSLPYVAHWADGDLRIVQATATAVLDTARTILDRLAAATGALTDPLADVTS